MVRASSFDDTIAMEGGRLYAARVIAENAEQRKKVEETYGLEYCKMRWPEAYRKGTWRDLLKFIPDCMNPFKDR